MHRHRSMARRPVHAREKGMALAVALFAMTALLLATGSALLVASSGIRATRNYRGASQVHLVAESGIAHALQVVNGPGVINFGTDVVNRWTTLFGTGAQQFAPISGYTYTVSAIADGTDPANWGRFISTATGPQGETNRVVARVNRTNVPRTASFRSSSERSAGSMTGPGRMQFTRTRGLRVASSTANERVMVDTAPLEGK